MQIKRATQANILLDLIDVVFINFLKKYFQQMNISSFA